MLRANPDDHAVMEAALIALANLLNGPKVCSAFYRDCVFHLTFLCLQALSALSGLKGFDDIARILALASDDPKLRDGTLSFSKCSKRNICVLPCTLFIKKYSCTSCFGTCSRSCRGEPKPDRQQRPCSSVEGCRWRPSPAPRLFEAHGYERRGSCACPSFWYGLEWSGYWCRFAPVSLFLRKGEER